MLPMFLKTKNKKSGFGLLEAVFYIAGFAIVALGVVAVLMLVLNNYFQFIVNSRIATSANDAVFAIVRSAQSATSFNLASSVFGQNPGTLALHSKDPTGADEQISIYLQNETVWITFNSGSPSRLTPTNVRVTNLTFNRLTNTNTEAVKFLLTLEASRGPYTKTADFQSMIVLRGSYTN